MTTMFNHKARRNPTWIKLLFRRIGIARFYRSLGRGWKESWMMAGKTI